MLRLRLSVAGGTSAASDSTVGLSFGSSWRAGPGAGFAGYRFVPTAEAGLTLRGEPVLKLGAFDVAVSGANAEAGETAGRSFCAENPPLCLIGAAAAVLGLIWAIDKATDRDEHPCPWAAGCD